MHGKRSIINAVRRSMTKPVRKPGVVRAWALCKNGKIKHWLLGGLCIMEIDTDKEAVVRGRWSCDLVEVEIRIRPTKKRRGR